MLKRAAKQVVRAFGFDVIYHRPYRVDGVTAGKIVTWKYEGKALSFFVVDDGDLIQREHLQSRFYEPDELEIIRKFFSGGTFMDVGANVGNHSIFAGAVLGADELVAIEPNPITFRLLCANIALNDLMPRTLIYRVGLSDRDGSAEIEWTPSRNLGNTSLRASESGSIELRNGDRLLNGRHVDFIKIDTEGMEIGGYRTLSQRVDPQCLWRWSTRMAMSFVRFCADPVISCATSFLAMIHLRTFWSHGTDKLRLRAISFVLPS